MQKSAWCTGRVNIGGKRIVFDEEHEEGGVYDEEHEEGGVYDEG